MMELWIKVRTSPASMYATDECVSLILSYVKTDIIIIGKTYLFIMIKTHHLIALKHDVKYCT